MIYNARDSLKFLVGSSGVPDNRSGSTDPLLEIGKLAREPPSSVVLCVPNGRVSVSIDVAEYDNGGQGVLSWA